MKKLLALLAATLFASAGAHATLISHSASHGPTQTDWDPARTLSLQKFDASLGLLNAVTFQFSGDMQARFIALNPNDVGQIITTSLQGSMHFMVPTLANADLGFADSDLVMLDGNSSSDTTLAASDSRSTTLLSGWDAFIGAGSFDVGVLALGSSSMSGSGNLDGIAVTQATARVTVTYDYDATRQAVPEPASLVLVGLALGALGLAARRRNG